ncbi:archaea-specific SMC-related protein [Haloplanus aerogenes]|uniref:AAA domain-containing protein n=1 Tax=Haloplanus aerogenes TaxID=660522 RepID=A0A3M0CG90_9EURY|nr:archaea-specific SMC-related protein [Haloplanus aerogenes]AZH24820.1 chromosome segregation protein SMC [Haloplanus aerogenes]RMB08362.1 AAA domain-containing protein [Haloplanus aerogenes]
MTETRSLEHPATFRVTNVGGIDETTVDIAPGVTVLTGRNATNRTSFLRSIMGVLGSDDVSLKGDAEEGRIELELGGEKYIRTLTRTNGTVATSGTPYLDDTELADLFAFLLESNEARQAVAMGADLRQLIMRPVDTAEIQAEIREREQEKSRIDDELSELESLKGELPELEEERTRLEADIEEKREALRAKEAEIESLDADVDETRDEKRELEARLEDLRDKRSALEQIRSDIDLEQQSIESLTTERRELESELDDLPEAPMGEHDELDREITRLRNRTDRLESEMSNLQDVIQFNEELLDGDENALAGVLRADDGAVTDELVEDTVVCWTCGSEVDTERITETLDQLRSVRQEKLETIRELEAELEELRDEQRELRDRQRRRERVERKLDDIEAELEQRNERLADLREERERLNDDIDDLEAEVETLEDEEFGEILDLHKEANQLEFELGRLESDLDDVTDRIATVEDRLAEEHRLEEEREAVREELTDLRTRIDRIESESVEQFNDHMDAVLDILGYANLERIWIEPIEQEIRQGRRTVERTAFELHVVRSTDTGATYEDTVDHLSESEREVTGLVFALAGYLVHEVYETVPFMLLDSLEAIDSERLANLVAYMAEYPTFLVVALLPEDAQALDDAYARVTDI